MRGVVGILLAAGSSQRFGGNKLLYPLATGEVMGLAAARNLITAVPDALVVIRPGDLVMAKQLGGLGLEVVENARADEGMGLSLATAVSASIDAAGWVVALADMPWISPQTIATVAQAVEEGASLVQPVYQGRPGHPVGFSRIWGDQLQALSGDQGARGLLEKHSNELLLQPTEDQGVLLDIDSEEDLKANVS